MATELFTNEAATTVSSGGTGAPAQGTVESWTVSSSSSFPAISGSQQFHVADAAAVTEIIAVTAVSGTTWTVTRGAESTTPVTHASGFTVQQVISAGTLGTFAQAGAGDLGGTGAAPTVLATHLSAALPVAQGGTAATTAAAALASLGALPVAGGTMTGWLAPAVVTLTFVGSGTTTVNAASGNSFALTLTASTTTLGAPSNPVDGQCIRVRLIQDATGSRTIAYNTVYDFGAAGAPTLSTGASKVDILGFEYVASLTKWCYLGSRLGF